MPRRKPKGAKPGIAGQFQQDPAFNQEPGHPNSWRKAHDAEGRLVSAMPSAIRGIDILELDLDPGQLIDSTRLRRIFGNRSAMWVWRNVRAGNLPSPIRIAGRNYWSPFDIRQRIARAHDRSESLARDSEV